MAMYLRTVLACIFLIGCESAVAGKPVKAAPAEAPQVYSLKIDYAGGYVIADGANLSPGTAAAEFGGVGLSPEPASSDSQLLFAFTPALELAVNELGNYVFTLTTDGGDFTLSAFIPLPLTIPTEPPPPGPDCPCSPEWDAASTTPSPGGFSGLIPYCQEDTGNWLTVQFYDVSVGNYWVLWTGWDPGSETGYCELYIDGPNRVLDNETQFEACAAYVRTIQVWGDQGNMCLF